VVALVAVFVLVASVTGGGTYALLSDEEYLNNNTLTVNPNVESGMVQTTPVQCSPKIGSGSPANVSVTVLESENVTGSSCAEITFWLNQTDFAAYAPTDLAPQDAIVMHYDGSVWLALNTTWEYSDEHDLHAFTAYTDSFSPFVMAVPNESAPSIQNQTSLETGNQSASSPAQNGTLLQTGNGSVDILDEDVEGEDIEYGEGAVVPGSVFDFRSAAEDYNRSVTKEDARLVENANEDIGVELGDDTVVIDYNGTEVEYERNEPGDQPPSNDSSGANNTTTNNETEAVNDGDGNEDDADNSDSQKGSDEVKDSGENGNSENESPGDADGDDVDDSGSDDGADKSGDSDDDDSGDAKNKGGSGESDDDGAGDAENGDDKSTAETERDSDANSTNNSSVDDNPSGDGQTVDNNSSDDGNDNSNGESDSEEETSEDSADEQTDNSGNESGDSGSTEAKPE
jgi:predicted ribosomally synthesized peptide with SipW-like signal peptide